MWVIKGLITVAAILFSVAFVPILGRSAKREPITIRPGSQTEKTFTRASSSDFLILPESIITEGPP